MNNSIYMVRFVEPPYGGSSTDVFLFTSIQAIYGTFTKEQIGCGVNRLWNIGLAKGNAYKSKYCTITKEPFMRMKRKSAPISDDNLTNDSLHDNKSKR